MASLPPDSSPKTSINFRSLPHHTATKEIQWSDSTDIGDFVKEAAQDREFSITISSPSAQATSSPPSEKKENDESKNNPNETNIRVLVPSFKARTRFLRHRLGSLSAELSKLEKIKRDCDHVAHRSARRLALGGFGLLLVYFGVVARLTFWDLGWDIMEPVTYLSGLTWIIAGYMWFLYQGREVSYSSLLKQSVSTRRAKLYEANGLDVDLWADLVAEEKQIRREIYKIADDYNIKWDGSPEGNFTVPNSTSQPAKTQKAAPSANEEAQKDTKEDKKEPETPEDQRERAKKVEEKANIERDDGKRKGDD